ncbi:hypothetical protein C8R47DRAFT_1064241 [Mycena vitilis]|nr:hypothetical protein C8R47DRAFT_1064241 [Mycena vitilis]
MSDRPLGNMTFFHPNKERQLPVFAWVPPRCSIWSRGVGFEYWHRFEFDKVLRSPNGPPYQAFSSWSPVKCSPHERRFRQAHLGGSHVDGTNGSEHPEPVVFWERYLGSGRRWIRLETGVTPTDKCSISAWMEPGARKIVVDGVERTIRQRIRNGWWPSSSLRIAIPSSVVDRDPFQVPVGCGEEIVLSDEGEDQILCRGIKPWWWCLEACLSQTIATLVKEFISEIPTTGVSCFTIWMRPGVAEGLASHEWGSNGCVDCPRPTSLFGGGGSWEILGDPEIKHLLTVTLLDFNDPSRLPGARGYTRLAVTLSPG